MFLATNVNFVTKEPRRHIYRQVFSDKLFSSLMATFHLKSYKGFNIFSDEHKFCHQKTQILLRFLEMKLIFRCYRILLVTNCDFVAKTMEWKTMNILVMIIFCCYFFLIATKRFSSLILSTTIPTVTKYFVTKNFNF